MSESKRSLHLAHLYPNLMNLYGDRGNISCLRQRCEARGITLQVDELGLGEGFDPGRYDLIFMGGGQDREQWRVGEDLLQRKGGPMREAVEVGVPALTVCGGYQMMGHYYQTADGRRLPGLGIYDLITVHPGNDNARCIGNVEVLWEDGDLVGFENHGGRTYLGSGARPLARVVAGFGNNGEDGSEGCRYRNAFGTYLHGSLLPKNPRLADYLLGLSLERKYGVASLAPLDDRIEQRAHEVAAAVARRDAASHGSAMQRARQGFRQLVRAVQRHR
ncbi:MAG: type 1 glutamine amidotransferase [Dehalococcoidia bacterium]